MHTGDGWQRNAVSLASCLSRSRRQPKRQHDLLSGPLSNRTVLLPSECPPHDQPLRQHCPCMRPITLEGHDHSPQHFHGHATGPQGVLQSPGRPAIRGRDEAVGQARLSTHVAEARDEDGRLELLQALRGACKDAEEGMIRITRDQAQPQGNHSTFNDRGSPYPCLRTTWVIVGR